MHNLMCVLHKYYTLLNVHWRNRFECHLGAENLFVGFTYNVMGKFKKLSWK